MWNDKQEKGQKSMLTRGDGHHAVFIGWQKKATGETFALYNITLAGHPLRGSTVSDRRLLGLHLRIPPTPARPVSEGVRPGEDGGPEMSQGEDHEQQHRVMDRP
jgi:hypothetical protein